VDAVANTVKASITLDKMTYLNLAEAQCRRFDAASDLNYIGSRDTMLASQSNGKIYILNAQDLSVLRSIGGFGQDEPTLELDPFLTCLVLDAEQTPASEIGRDVVQDVEHPVQEPVAHRDAKLLRLQAEHDWADAVQQRITYKHREPEH